MSEGDDRPFREPCDGQSLCGAGPLWQHGTNTAQNIPQYINTTGVPDWASSGTINPYERWTPDPGGGESCDTHFCVDGGAPCVAWPKPYPTNTFASSGTNIDLSLCHKTGFKNVQARRTWHGCFGWVSSCVNCNTNLCSDGSGYRSWQGTADQTKYLVCTIASTLSSGWDDTDGSTFYNFFSSTATTRTVNAQTGEITETKSNSESDSNTPDSGGSTTTTSDMTDGVGTVDGTTYANNAGSLTDAILSVDFHCDTPPLPSAGGFFGGNDSLIAAISDWNAELLLGSGAFPAPTDPNNYNQIVNVGDGAGGVIGSYKISWSRSATVFSWDVEFTRDVGAGQNYSFSGSATLSSANTSADIYSDVVTLLNEWPLNDDTLYPWRTDLKVSVAPLVTRNEFVTIATPIGFNSFTQDDFRSPINDASGNAPFSAGWTPTFSQMNWKDPNIWVFTFADGTQAAVGGSFGASAAATGLMALFDGSIVGAPLPAGYKNFFDFGFLDVRGCCDRPPDNPGVQTWSWYQVGWGQTPETFNSNSGCGLPLNATQWNNWFEAVNKPQGAYLFYADQGQGYFGQGCVSSGSGSGAGDAGQLVGCKYAEILEMWPSQNFALPAGDMKFWFDENHVFCATNISGSGAGSTWSLTDPITGTPPPDSTDFSGDWGGSVVSGFYNVTSYSGGTLTLGSKIWDVPSNWSSKSNSDEALCFGKLRFPSYPSLLGRVKITPDVAGTAFTFETPQPAFGMDDSTHQEKVDLWDETMTSLASNVTATRVDDSTFTTGSAYLTAKYVTIHGGPAWYVNDTRPKGDYAFLQWVADFRAPGEYLRLNGALDCSGTQIPIPATVSYTNADCNDSPITVTTPGNGYAQFCQTEGCRGFARCNPRVICISPNCESFPNGITYPFPNVSTDCQGNDIAHPITFSLDEQYGSKWWGYVQSTMTDLYWQQPHRPCNIEPCAKWQMDGGSCADDQALDCPVFCCPGDDDYDPDSSQPPTYYYGHAPQAEPRLSVPNNYGMSQDESGPTLPTGIQVGWLSPVNNTTGDIAFPPVPPGALGDNGAPAGAAVTWDLHALFCGSGPGCRFSGYTVPGCDPA